MPDPLGVLLIGCGDLAARLARRRTTDWHFTGLRRRSVAVPGVELVTGDACSTETLQSMLAPGVDVVVATLTPPAFTDEGYEAGYVAPARALREACDALPSSLRPRRLLWVSSTRVYGENGGGWVDETTEPQPQGFAGRRLLEAERALLMSDAATTVVRFSGIYGPGRDRLIRVVKGGRIAPAVPVQWTNRIHSDDCAGVLAHLIECEMRGEALANLYVGSDCEPVSAHEVQSWLAQRLGVSPVEETVADSVSAGRRCSNQRLLDSGYRFRYPTWQDGYQELLADT